VSAEHTWDPNAALPPLTTAAAIDPPGACGMKGFVLLHGLLAEQVQTGGATFTSQIVVHNVPTYYGMMAATFIKQ